MPTIHHYRSLPALKTRPFLEIAPPTLTYASSLLSYRRAEAASLPYGMTMTDLLNLTPKFWDFHMDPVIALDSAAFTIMTIQYNLCAGTIARFAIQRPDLAAVVRDLLQFRKHGQFLLTEVGHGIDMANLETTATLLPSGEFILNTPNPQAAKMMPPTLPAGKPCIAVVFARLMVGLEDRGIRPFIVALNDGVQMCAGIRAKVLPDRGGTTPVNHCITYFHNVRLPSTSLLGSLDAQTSNKSHLAEVSWRIAIGSMALGCLAIPLMQIYTTIGVKYSLRRHVGPSSARMPIMAFRTQQIPLVAAIAQVHVLQAYAEWAIKLFRDTSLPMRVRHGLATVLKAVMVQHSQAAAMAISERSGAQGLFAHNQITNLHGTMRGISIAEGDILALSIRLITELLQDRYALPAPRDPTSVLAQHETHLFISKCAIMASSPISRSDTTNRLILPHCQPLVEAIGHRMAYEAAVSAGVSQDLIDMYLVSVVKLDAGWYIEYLGMTGKQIEEMECSAVDRLVGNDGGKKVEALVDAFGVEESPFDRDDGDIVLQSSDGVKFSTHKIILTIASPFFADMFAIGSASQSTATGDDTTNSGTPVIPVTETSATLDTFLRLVYPVDKPALKGLAEIAEVLEAGRKYQASAVSKPAATALRGYITSNPHKVFAIACRMELEEEARMAAKHCASLQNPPEFHYDPDMKHISAGPYFRLQESIRFSQSSWGQLKAGLTFLRPGLCALDAEQKVLIRHKLSPAACLSSWTASDIPQRVKPDRCVQSFDGVTFPVHSVVLSLASPILQAMLDDVSFSGTSVFFPEPSYVLLPLLRLCYGLPQGNEDGELNISYFVNLVRSAQMYKISKGVDLLRNTLQAFIQTRPLSVYFIAASLEWEEVTRGAATATAQHYQQLKDVYVSAMEDVPASVYYNLLVYNQEVTTTVQTIVDKYSTERQLSAASYPENRFGYGSGVTTSMQKKTEKVFECLATRELKYRGYNYSSSLLEESRSLDASIETALAEVKLKLA
ncbi:hypothetical protein EIP91_001930 [Steccherinum ochraceum]|uniref:BTB domain-containing protein n=1 Tax=Steccherinum ochraceum TaxID=92696 RepID=A0A4R0RGT2_9APHY|nr:hypothetical protein EIP91_001930 [Steccherinum ochraceum]